MLLFAGFLLVRECFDFPLERKRFFVYNLEIRQGFPNSCMYHFKCYLNILNVAQKMYSCISYNCGKNKHFFLCGIVFF
jgi:hypothetical protein